jgi:hypothetical protein
MLKKSFRAATAGRRATGRDALIRGRLIPSSPPMSANLLERHEV